MISHIGHHPGIIIGHHPGIIGHPSGKLAKCRASCGILFFIGNRGFQNRSAWLPNFLAKFGPKVAYIKRVAYFAGKSGPSCLFSGKWLGMVANFQTKIGPSCLIGGCL